MENKGHLLYTTLRPSTSADTFAIAYANEIMGGHHSYDSLIERDSISSERRKEGMTVYVSGSTFILSGGTSNLDWVQIPTTIRSAGSGNTLFDLNNGIGSIKSLVGNGITINDTGSELVLSVNAVMADNISNEAYDYGIWSVDTFTGATRQALANKFNLIDNSLNQFIRIDGTIPFTGNQSMGGKNLTSINKLRFDNTVSNRYVDVQHNTGGTFQYTSGWNSSNVYGFYSVHFVDENNGYAVGFNGSNVAVIYKTTNAGTTWVQYVSGWAGTDANSFESIYFTDENIGYAVGGDSNNIGVVFKTTDAGTTWTKYVSSWITTDVLRLTSVYFIDENIGYAVGLNSTNTGVIFKTTNAGTTWVQYVSGWVFTDVYSFYSVHFTDINNGYAVGFAGAGPSVGTIFKTTDAGATWTKYVSGWSFLNVQNFNSVYFVDENTGYAVGDNAFGVGVIYKTVDAGVTWIVYDQNALNSTTLYEIYFINRKTAFIVGFGSSVGVIYKLKDYNKLDFINSTLGNQNTILSYVDTPIDDYDAVNKLYLNDSLTSALSQYVPLSASTSSNAAINNNSYDYSSWSSDTFSGATRQALANKLNAVDNNFYNYLALSGGTMSGDVGFNNYKLTGYNNITSNTTEIGFNTDYIYPGAYDIHSRSYYVGTGTTDNPDIEYLLGLGGDNIYGVILSTKDSSQGNTFLNMQAQNATLSSGYYSTENIVEVKLNPQNSGMDSKFSILLTSGFTNGLIYGLDFVSDYGLLTLSLNLNRRVSFNLDNQPTISTVSLQFPTSNGRLALYNEVTGATSGSVLTTNVNQTILGTKSFTSLSANTFNVSNNAVISGNTTLNDLYIYDSDGTSPRLALDATIAGRLNLGFGYTTVKLNSSAGFQFSATQMQTPVSSTILQTGLLTFASVNTNTVGTSYGYQSGKVDTTGNYILSKYTYNVAPTSASTGLTQTSLAFNEIINDVSGNTLTFTHIDINPTVTKIFGNLYGLRSRIMASGTSVYNLYIDGTAPNYFRGNLRTDSDLYTMHLYAKDADNITDRLTLDVGSSGVLRVGRDFTGGIFANAVTSPSYSGQTYLGNSALFGLPTGSTGTLLPLTLYNFTNGATPITFLTLINTRNNLGIDLSYVDTFLNIVDRSSGGAFGVFPQATVTSFTSGGGYAFRNGTTAGRQFSVNYSTLFTPAAGTYKTFAVDTTQITRSSGVVNMTSINAAYTIFDTGGSGSMVGLSYTPIITQSSVSANVHTGFLANPSLVSIATGGTIYGFRSQIATTLSGTTYNIYADGTAPNLLFGATTIGASSASTQSAILDLVSTSRGLGLPSMTSTQRIAISSPRNGLMVYQNDGTNGVYTYINGAWGLLGSTGNTGSFNTGNGIAGQIAFWSGNTAQGGDTAFKWDNSNKALLIGSTAVFQIQSPVYIEVSANTFYHYNIRNASSGTSAAAEYALTNNNGSLNLGFSAFGINSSGFADTGYTIMPPSSTYLLVNGGDLTIGTQTANNIIFHTSGTSLNNKVGMITSTGLWGKGNIIPTALLDINSGTTSYASMRIRQTTIANIPTTPNIGDFFHTNNNSFVYVTGTASTKSIISKIPAYIFVQKNITTLTNSSVRTNILGTGETTSNTFIMPAGFITSSKVIRIRAQGTIAATATPNFTMDISIGNLVLTTNANNVGVITGTNIWYLDAWIRCDSTGVAGTVYGAGNFNFYTVGNTSTTFSLVPNSGAGVATALNTTVDNIITINGTWSTPSLSNTITMDSCFIEHI